MLKLLQNALIKVNKFSFEAKSPLDLKGWNGVGLGKVTVEQIDKNIIIFDEVGKFLTPEKKQITCKNTYRWTFENELVHLEHLRFGVKNPVYLFALIHKKENLFISSCPHVCNKDLYTTKLIILDNEITLNWEIKGEEKNEIIIYHYL